MTYRHLPLSPELLAIHSQSHTFDLPRCLHGFEAALTIGTTSYDGGCEETTVSLNCGLPHGQTGSLCPFFSEILFYCYYFV